MSVPGKVLSAFPNTTTTSMMGLADASSWSWLWGGPHDDEACVYALPSAAKSVRSYRDLLLRTTLAGRSKEAQAHTPLA